MKMHAVENSNPANRPTSAAMTTHNKKPFSNTMLAAMQKNFSFKQCKHENRVACCNFDA